MTSLIGKKTYGGLNDVVGTDRSPLDVGGFTLTEDGNGLALNVELSVFSLYVSLVASVNGIVFEHVDHVLEVNERTKRSKVSLTATRLKRATYSLTATTSIPCTSSALRRTIRPIRPKLNDDSCYDENWKDKDLKKLCIPVDTDFNLS